MTDSDPIYTGNSVLHRTAICYCGFMTSVCAYDNLCFSFCPVTLSWLSLMLVVWWSLCRTI